MPRRRRTLRKQPITISKSDIPLIEFKYFNNKKEIISPVILKRIENKIKNCESVKWSNKIFAENKIGFEFYKNRSNSYIKLLQFDYKFNCTDLIKSKHIINNKIFITFELTDEQKTIISKFVKFPTDIKKMLRFNTWEELQTYIIDNLLLYSSDNSFAVMARFYNVMLNKKFHCPFKYFSVKKTTMQNAIIMFCKQYNICIFKRDQWMTLSRTVNYKYYDKIEYAINSLNNIKFNCNNTTRSAFYLIYDVIEKRIKNKNYRIAIVCKFLGRGDDYNQNFRIRIVSENECDYTRIDKDAIYIKSSYYEPYYFDLKSNKYDNANHLIINPKIINKIRDNLQNLLAEGNNVIPSDIVEFYNKRFGHIDDDDDSEKFNNLTIQEMKINTQYIKILKQNRPVKFNDIKITQTSIEIMAQDFKLEFESNFIDVIDNFIDIKRKVNNINATYDLNTLYTELLNLSPIQYIHPDYSNLYEYKDFKKTKFVLNNIPINIERDEYTNKIYINGIFCRVSDVQQVLKNAICFYNVEDYNKYIKDISYIGMEWKSMISNGVKIEIKTLLQSIFDIDKKYNQKTVYLRFSLLWDSEKRKNVYLVLNNEKYLIKYKGKFKNKFNKPKRIMTISDLRKELAKTLESYSDDALFNIIDNAIKEGEIILKRGRKLVEDTLKLINAEECEEEILHKTVSGYKFKGLKSKQIYFIDKKSLSVYKYDNGSWNMRCINDNTNKNRIFEDRLANRLINIYNEPHYLKSYL